MIPRSWTVFETDDGEIRRVGSATLCSPKTLSKATSHAIQRRSDRLAHPRFRLLIGHYRSGERPDTAISYAGDERRHRGKKQEHE
jgi:hypothetical protein